ncbi:MAG: molybdopterin molybdotransferase MoeA [Acidobacteriota bacterium]
MLTPQDAWDRIAPHATPLPIERCERDDAHGLVLASSPLATADQPPADVSAMDGVIVAGPVSAGATVPVVGEIQAGHPSDTRLEPGSAARIMTGAVVPEGGDRVVPVEQITVDAARRHARIEIEPVAGAHIRRQGEVVAMGTPLLEPGRRLGAVALSLLAGHGHGHVDVVRPPTIAVLTTGDEIVPPDATPEAGQLRDSNTTFLLAALAARGLTASSLGIAPDRLDMLADRIGHGLEHDVLLLCGGVSKGEHDHVEAVLDELGCEPLFDHVGMQPGKPLVVARHANGWVVGLPGNPASVMVGFSLFVLPLLARLMGDDEAWWWRDAVAARLAGPSPPGKPRDLFLPAALARVEGELEATPLKPRGSHDVAAWARADALLHVPRGAAPRAIGTACEVLPL